MICITANTSWLSTQLSYGNEAKFSLHVASDRMLCVTNDRYDPKVYKILGQNREFEKLTFDPLTGKP